MAHARTWIDTGAEIAMMTEVAETMTEATIPGQAVAEEGSVAGTVGMTTTEEVRAAMKTDTTDEMTGPGVPEMITLGMIIGGMTEVPPKDAN